MKLKLLIPLTIYSSLSFAKVPIDESLWARIDKLNKIPATLVKPVSSRLLSEVLQEAAAIIHDPALDSDYQKVRAESFATDFAQATALTKRAEPLFEVI